MPTFMKRISCLRPCSIALWILVFLFSAEAQQTYFPQKNWVVKNPIETGMRASLIDSALALARLHETSTDPILRVALQQSYAREPGYRIFGPVKDRGKPVGLIIHKGYVVGQWGDPDQVDMTFSVTKSFLSTVAGLAMDAGLIGEIDEKVKAYVWDSTFQESHNAKISWRHLLDQSSDWSGCLFEFCDWADRPPRDGTIEEWKSRKLLEPGAVFEYNDVRVNLLAYALLQVWRKPLPQVLKEKIMDPIGASTTWRWYGYDNSFVNIDGVMVQSVSGGGHFGGGLFISTRDMARFGLLFLRKGMWNGKQLVSREWIEAARTPSKANPSYGLMWWLNTENTLPGLSKDIYYADGYGGNKILVDEENDLVIVVRWMDNSKFSEFLKLVYASLN